VEGIVPSSVDLGSERSELLEAREKRRKVFDASISRGLAAAKAGRTKPAEEVFDRLEAKYREMARQRRKD
jgi:antitoxin ParD1/3/4